MSEPVSQTTVNVLVTNHRRFLDFLRVRVPTADDAEEILQAAFVRCKNPAVGASAYPSADRRLGRRAHLRRLGYFQSEQSARLGR